MKVLGCTIHLITPKERRQNFNDISGMNHLEAVYSGKNQMWRYLVMIAVVVFAANTIGSVPLLVVYLKAIIQDPSISSEFASNPSNISLLGTGPVEGLILLLVPFLVMFVCFWLLIKPLNERTFMQTVNGTDSFRFKRYFAGASVWLLLSAIYLVAYLGIDPGNFRLNNLTTSLVGLIITTLLLIPFQAGSEELLMRGYLMQGFYRLIPKRWFPLLATSLIFALMHALNPEVKAFGFLTMMPQYFLIGLSFGMATLMDDGIEVAMGAHTANNIFLSVMVTHKSSALQTPSVYEQLIVDPWLEFLGLFLMSVIFLFVLGRKYNWNLRFLYR